MAVGTSSKNKVLLKLDEDEKSSIFTEGVQSEVIIGIGAISIG